MSRQVQAEDGSAQGHRGDLSNAPRRQASVPQRNQITPISPQTRGSAGVGPAGIEPTTSAVYELPDRTLLRVSGRLALPRRAPGHPRCTTRGSLRDELQDQHQGLARRLTFSLRVRAMESVSIRGRPLIRHFAQAECIACRQNRCTLLSMRPWCGTGRPPVRRVMGIIRRRRSAAEFAQRRRPAIQPGFSCSAVSM